MGARRDARADVGGDPRGRLRALSLEAGEVRVGGRESHGRRGRTYRPGYVRHVRSRAAQRTCLDEAAYRKVCNWLYALLCYYIVCYLDYLILIFLNPD